MLLPTSFLSRCLDVEVSLRRECQSGNCPPSAEPARTASNCKKLVVVVVVVVVAVVVVVVVAVVVVVVVVLLVFLMMMVR